VLIFSPSAIVFISHDNSSGKDFLIFHHPVSGDRKIQLGNWTSISMQFHALHFSPA
jgi:hypothetical protein